MNYNTLEIEEIILGMADIVMENRHLRKLVDDLSLDKAKNEAFVDVLTCRSKEKEERYEKLRDAQENNMSIDLMNSSGWSHNRDKIDWRKI